MHYEKYKLYRGENMKNINCSMSELLESIVERKKKVICLGTGVMAKEALSISTIAKAVIACADNDFGKQGKFFICDGLRYPIISPNDIKQYLNEYDERELLVLIANSHFDAILKQLADIKELNETEVYIYPLINLNFRKDSLEFFERRLIEEAVKEYCDVLEVQNKTAEEIITSVEELRQTMHENAKSDKKVAIIPRMMVMPTTKCTMRCEGCSSLLPYFKKPEDVQIEQIIRDLDIFFNGIDRCIRLTIGGEPFLYPSLKPLLEYLINQPKLDGILMITNSTLLPTDKVLPLLENQKIFIQISDYGHIEKMSRLVALLEKREIRFKVLSEQIWTDMGNTDFRDKDEERLRYEYLNCEQGRIIKAIFNGKMYICGRSARMQTLGSYVSEHDFIELDSTDSKEETAEKMNRLYFTDYADACNYCDCGKFPTQSIPAGLQIGKSFLPSKYTLVDREEYDQLKRLVDIQNPVND
jgi:organic radical activating enzyme